MNLVIIGSGNIATHLAKACYATDHNILQVYSPTLANANALASVVNSQSIDDLQLISKHADVYLIAVSDAAIHHVTPALDPSMAGMVARTSAATSTRLSQAIRRCGVTSPPRGLNEEIGTDRRVIPFSIEADAERTCDTL